MNTWTTTGRIARARGSWSPAVLALWLAACGGIESHSLGGNLAEGGGGEDGAGGSASGGASPGAGGGLVLFGAGGSAYPWGGGPQGMGGSWTGTAGSGPIGGFPGSGGGWGQWAGAPGSGGNPPVGTGGGWVGYGGAGTGGAIGSGGEPGGCPPGQKMCGGFCAAPNPGIGCGLTGCTSCPLPPANGYGVCSGEECSFECFLGYARNAAGSGCEPAPGAGSSDGGTDGAVGTWEAGAAHPQIESSSTHPLGRRSSDAACRSSGGASIEAAVHAS